MVAFFYELDRNVESVDDFFTKKSTDVQRRFKLLMDKYGDSRSDQLDFHELEDLVYSHLVCAHIGWGINGLALANAETFGIFFLSRVLISVVRGREQARLHQNLEKVSPIDTRADLDWTKNLRLTRNLDISPRKYSLS